MKFRRPPRPTRSEQKEIYHLAGSICRRLFRPLSTDLSTWSAWIVFLKATFGIEMDAAELDTFQR
jgi:hypothetical protein